MPSTCCSTQFPTGCRHTSGERAQHPVSHAPSTNATCSTRIVPVALWLRVRPDRQQLSLSPDSPVPSPSTSAAAAPLCTPNVARAHQNSAPSSGCLSFRFEPLHISCLIDISTSTILLSYLQAFMTSSPETTPELLSTHGRLTLVLNRTSGGNFG